MRQWTVDAFASAPFTGNPACVVEPFDAWPGDQWMQAVAAENNQAETAFLLRTPEQGRYGLRWMTPAAEVPLCGHATLAAAHVLFGEIGTPGDRLAFDTRSGPLTVHRTSGGYDMNFPSDPPRRIETPPGLAAAIGVTPAETWVASYLVAILPDEGAVRALRPGLAPVERISAAATGGRGDLVVAAFASATSGADVVSRFFAPSVGIPEDPATGSAHCILSPLYSAKLGRPAVRFYQAYPGRGAFIETEQLGDRVRLRGGGITMIESLLRIQPAIGRE